MTPSARLSAAIEILDVFARSDHRMMDRILADWARSNRYAGSKDRAAIADRVYACLRAWRSFGAAVSETGRGRVLASLKADGLQLSEIEALCDGSRFAPPPLDAAERARLSAACAAPPHDWPDWLWPELAASVEDPAAEAACQRRRAPLDLRVNTFKATVDTARAALLEAGVSAEPGPVSPLCLRIDPPRPIKTTPAFLEGWVEPQDAASQAAAALATAGRDLAGGTILDYCAGGGGKALALAAAAPSARIVAHDVAPERMADLAPRAARAGAAIATCATADLRSLYEACDVVFVDAPCSGSGAWARNPDAKWRLTPERLTALRAAQADAIRAAADFVRPGGRLIYATCSLLASENRGVVAAFLAEDPGFTPMSIDPLWRAAGLQGARPGAGRDDGDVSFSPVVSETDGFYVMALKRA